MSVVVLNMQTDVSHLALARTTLADQRNIVPERSSDSKPFPVLRATHWRANRQCHTAIKKVFLTLLFYKKVFLTLLFYCPTLRTPILRSSQVVSAFQAMPRRIDRTKALTNQYGYRKHGHRRRPKYETLYEPEGEPEVLVKASEIVKVMRGSTDAADGRNVRCHTIASQRPTC